MKQCGQCGTQNTDQSAACVSCGAPLGPAAQSLGGTLLVQPPEAPPPPAPPAPAAPRNLKETMLGLAPPQLEPAPTAPSTNASRPTAASSGRPLGATMIGIAPPTYPAAPTPPPPSEAPFPQPPPAPLPGEQAPGAAPRLPSAQKTVLGVARPGIAPLHPGQPKSPPPPAPQGGAIAPIVFPPPAPLPVISAPQSRGVPPARRPAPSRISLGAALAIVGAAALLVLAVVAFLMLRGRGSVTARAVLDSSGKESLELSCAECPDGTKVWVDLAPVAFRGGKATLGLQAQLRVGENPIVLVMERPGRSREEIALALPIEYRVRGSTDLLAQDKPQLSVLASVLAGTQLVVDGKPVTAGGAEPTRFDYDVTADVTGPEASVKSLERVIPYKATSASGAVQAGQVEVRLGITPLIVDAPGAAVVLDAAELVIAGRTAPGAQLRVGAQAVNLDAQGRFVAKVALAPGDNSFTVRSTLTDHAPRLIQVSAKRSDALERDYALLRSRADASFADVLRAPEATVGRTVWLEGQLFDARHDGYSSVLLLDVKGGCKASPCLAKVIHGVVTSWEKGRALKATGRLARFVDGPRTGERIPEVRAELVVAGGK